MIDAIAAIGDAADINCWSGIPFHFWQAALARKWNTRPIRVPVNKVEWRRRVWNLGRIIGGHRVGGYQYSNAFSEWAWKYFPPGHCEEVVSFHPFTPSIRRLTQGGAKFSLYFDATHPLLFERYGLAAQFSRRTRESILAKEREIFQQASRLVFFQRWAAESAVRDCGAERSKVFVILPGANLLLPASFEFRELGGRPGVDRPLRLGFVGKDWKRKGFPRLLAVAETLGRMGLKVVIECIGGLPPVAARHPLVRYHGFLSKSTALPQILDIMAECDFGCLLSDAEASSIAVLEFIRVGVPVIATIVDGMTDLVPPDAGLRISPAETPNGIAEQIFSTVAEPINLAQLRGRARQWAGQVTWARCLSEWEELLRTGRVGNAVQLWRGLNPTPAIFPSNDKPFRVSSRC